MLVSSSSMLVFIRIYRSIVTADFETSADSCGGDTLRLGAVFVVEGRREDAAVVVDVANFAGAVDDAMGAAAGAVTIVGTAAAGVGACAEADATNNGAATGVGAACAAAFDDDTIDVGAANFDDVGAIGDPAAAGLGGFDACSCRAL